jgi:hypothetical protein
MTLMHTWERLEAGVDAKAVALGIEMLQVTAPLLGPLSRA